MSSHEESKIPGKLLDFERFPTPGKGVYHVYTSPYVSNETHVKVPKLQGDFGGHQGFNSWGHSPQTIVTLSTLLY